MCGEKGQRVVYVIWSMYIKILKQINMFYFSQ